MVSFRVSRARFSHLLAEYAEESSFSEQYTDKMCLRVQGCDDGQCIQEGDFCPARLFP